jgi:hypothetical protein
MKTITHPQPKERMKYNSIDGGADKPLRGCWRAAASLKPDANMMLGCISGNLESIAIRNSWAFRAKVTLLSPDAYHSLVERARTTFGG